MNIFKASTKKTIKDMVKQSKHYSRKGQLGEASCVLSKCLNIAENYYTKGNHSEILKINEALADIKFREEQYEGALEIYSHIISQSYSKDSKFLTIIRHKETTTINKILERSHHKPKLVKTKVDVLVRDAENHIENGKYDEAKNCLQRASRSSKMLYENNHLDKINKLMTDIDVAMSFQ